MKRALVALFVAAGLVLSGCADTGQEDEGDDTTSTVEEDGEDEGDDTTSTVEEDGEDEESEDEENEEDD